MVPFEKLSCKYSLRALSIRERSAHGIGLGNRPEIYFGLIQSSEHAYGSCSTAMPFPESCRCVHLVHHFIFDPSHLLFCPTLRFAFRQVSRTVFTLLRCSALSSYFIRRWRRDFLNALFPWEISWAASGTLVLDVRSSNVDTVACGMERPLHS